MAYSVTSIAIGADATGAATAGITVPAGGVPAGALIVVCVAEASNAIGGSVADTAGNTYTRGPAVRTGGATGFGALYYAYSGIALVSGNTITVTKGTAANEVAASAIYITGAQTGSSPYDSAVAATAGGSSTSPTVTGGAPTVSGEILVGFCCLQANSTSVTFTEDTDYTNTPPAASTTAGAGSHPQCHFAVRNPYASTAADTYNPTLGATGAWAAGIAGFLPASGDTGGMLEVFDY